jgi:hypothetical protein
MRVSSKLWEKISSAIDDAAWDHAEKEIPDLKKRPPDDWSPDERKVFDASFALADSVKDKLKTMLRAS